jgi:acyl-CoA thioester hydrolase
MVTSINGKNYLLVFTMPMDVRWGEMDALGHVNNVSYFRYLEDARITWMAGLGAQPATAGEGFVLAHVECHFRRAIVYPERIEVLTYVGDLGRSNVPMYQEIRSAADRDILYAYGENRVVWIDFASGQSWPLPEALRARLVQTVYH